MHMPPIASEDGTVQPIKQLGVGLEAGDISPIAKRMVSSNLAGIQPDSDESMAVTSEYGISGSWRILTGSLNVEAMVDRL